MLLGLNMGLSTMYFFFFVDDTKHNKNDMDISLKENQWEYNPENIGKSSYLD
jgi:hypothetical protein